MGFTPYGGINSQITTPLILQVPAGANPAIGIGVVGDTTNRLELRGAGVVAIGPGGVTAPDTNMSRAGVGTMQFPSGGANVFGAADVKAAGTGLAVAEGANAKQGTAVLVAGTVTVANTSVTANSRIFLTAQALGGTQGILAVTARVAGTSFTITSSNAADTSTVAYEIVEPG